MLDPRKIFDQAESYFAATRVLKAHGAPHFLIPSAVFGAFALELYLKSLITLEGIPIKREHALTDLFALLSEECRTKIRNEFDGQPSAGLRALLGRQIGAKIDFDETLRVASNVFKRWRYSYEEKLDPSGWSDDILLATRSAILDMRSDWPKDFELG